MDETTSTTQTAAEEIEARQRAIIAEMTAEELAEEAAAERRMARA
jgi:hypothetical protein